jgi:type 1 glutamine amidotransferase
MRDRPVRVHLIAGGFPPGQSAGHDHDYARLRILQILEEKQIPASVGNDFHEMVRWLDLSSLLVTYVAGPYLNDDQAAAVRDWLNAGGRWLALHGTAGGKAARVEGRRQRVMVKTSHHETMGGFFINHPPVRRFTVNVADPGHPLTRGVPESFEVIDEPYMIEVQDLAASKILLTADLGPDTSPPGFGFIYEKDTALLPDGRTRVIAYERPTGRGAVAYYALGHCHSPTTNAQTIVDTNVDPEGKPPLWLRQTWETEGFDRLLRNAIDWGCGTGPSPA